MFNEPALAAGLQAFERYPPAEDLDNLVAFAAAQVDQSDDRDAIAVPASCKLVAA